MRKILRASSTQKRQCKETGGTVEPIAENLNNLIFIQLRAHFRGFIDRELIFHFLFVMDSANMRKFPEHCAILDIRENSEFEKLFGGQIITQII